jgi:hypothetical protein
MASELFNSISGYSVGIPAIPIIDANGRYTGNVNSNYIIANTLLTNNLRYANGQPYVAGSNTQVQFNNGTGLGASANLTFDNANSMLTTTNFTVNGETYLGPIENISITGGLNGYFLQTDGLGQLTWAAAGGGGGNGSPGGSNTQVQFNNAGDFGGDPGFTYNSIDNTLNVSYITATTVTANLMGVASSALTTETVTASSQPNITSVGTLISLGVTGNIQAQGYIGNGAQLTNINGANITGIVPVAEVANTVSQADQPNITSVGALTSLIVTGNISGANVQASNRTTTGNLFVTGNASIGGNLTINSGKLTANGNVDFNGADVEIGEIDNLKIFGGFTGQVMTTDGTGNLSWTDAGGGGGGNPGGANTNVQFNYNGGFAGSPNFTYNQVSHEVQVGGLLIANSFQIGSGAFEFGTSSVYFATTDSTGNQTLFGIPIDGLYGADYVIIATEPVQGLRQSLKISALCYQDQVQFNEYAGLQINGGVGTFGITFNPGDVVNPPSMDLYIVANTNNLVTYKMLITKYSY